jgi:hypothetical protein
MALRFFAVPVHDSSTFEQELNGFLASQNVVSIDRHLMVASRCQAWSLRGVKLCVRRDPCQVLIFSGCNSHAATGSLQPLAIGATVEETKPSEPSRQMCRFRRCSEPTGRNSQ